MNKIIRMEETPEQYDLAGKVIGFAMKVHSTLGSGFLESVYQSALALELRRAGLELVGAFVADLLVNDTLIVETKAIQVLAKIHEVQLVNYLVATGVDEGLLLNFGAEHLEFKKKFRRPKQQTASL